MFFTGGRGLPPGFRRPFLVSPVDGRLAAFLLPRREGPCRHRARWRPTTREKDPWYFDTMIRSTDNYSVNVDVRAHGPRHQGLVQRHRQGRRPQDRHRRHRASTWPISCARFRGHQDALASPRCSINDQGYLRRLTPTPRSITLQRLLRHAGSTAADPARPDASDDADSAARSARRAGRCAARHPGKVTSTAPDQIDGFRQPAGRASSIWRTDAMAYVLTAINLDQARIAGPNWWVPSADLGDGHPADLPDGGVPARSRLAAIVLRPIAPPAAARRRPWLPGAITTCRCPVTSGDEIGELWRAPSTAWPSRCAAIPTSWRARSGNAPPTLEGGA